ncbi:lactose-binding lectin l-2-like, partial [Ruditapes philippinarum]|uniref:lactose-binding lectin l-2-like n=1 Tax=Ruditapes philippinarum TaxID=129788 RepID=UPI00295B10AD
DVGVCPKGWKERPSSGTCYYISDKTDEKTWEKAMLTCKHRQGDMVKIDSIQEKSWLRNEIQSQLKFQNTDKWWIGLNNRPRFDNNYYKWGDGSSLNSNILRWNPGEPNNSGGREHCAQYMMTTDSINDKDCDLSMPYICEMKMYWTQPINKPGIVTHKPTLPQTVAPVTIPNKVPVPIGVTAVTSGPNVFTTGCFKQTDCAGKAWQKLPIMQRMWILLDMCTKWCILAKMSSKYEI